MIQTDIKIHSYRRCPFAMRVRMTLHEKNIAFETHEEDLKNFSQALKKHHPEAKVPVLIDGETVLYESAIITEYIEDKFPQNTLMPSNPADKAKVRLWTYWCNQDFKPHVDHYKYGTSRHGQQDVDVAPKNLINDLQKLETTLCQSPFLMGDVLTLADIHIFPFYRQLTKAQPYFPPLDDFPSCQKWFESIIRRPSFEKTIAKKTHEPTSS